MPFCIIITLGTQSVFRGLTYVLCDARSVSGIPTGFMKAVGGKIGGAIIIGVINNGLNMVGLSSYFQQIAMGVLIVLAVTLDRFFGSSSKT